MISGDLETSVLMKEALPPDDCIFFTFFFDASSSMSAIITLAPFNASFLAEAPPIP